MDALSPPQVPSVISSLGTTGRDPGSAQSRRFAEILGFLFGLFGVLGFGYIGFGGLGFGDLGFGGVGFGGLGFWGFRVWGFRVWLGFVKV